MSDKIVNHFVLADGSTAKYSATQLAGDVPEVADIRVGYDGTTYASAGDAVRGQTEEVLDGLYTSTGYKGIGFKSGYINLSGETADIANPTASTEYVYAVEPCSPGDTFTVNVKGGVTPRGYAFITSTGTILEVSESKATVNRTLTAPGNSAYLVLNAKTSNPYAAFKGQPIMDNIDELWNTMGYRRYTPGVGQTNVYYPSDYVNTRTYNSSTSWIVTDLVNIEGYDKIIYSGLSNVGTSPYSVWFDADKEPIQTFKQAIGTNELTIPAGAAFVSFSTLSQDVIHITAYNDDSYLGLQNTTELLVSGEAEKMAWSWWVTNRVVDNRGVLYFGFVTEDAYIGVGMRYPSGQTYTKKLTRTTNKDDHNAPAVNLLSDGTVVVTSCYGHGVNERRFVFVADEPNTINCTFTNKSFNLPHSQGMTIGTTYAQTFVYNDDIYTFYRYHTDDGVQPETAWAMLYSDDRGDTWTNYVALKTDFYCLFTETTIAGRLNFLMCDNPRSYVDNSIRGGYIDLATKTVYTDAGTSIPMSEILATGNIHNITTPYPGQFDVIIPAENSTTGNRHRLLAAAITAPGDHTFLWAQSTDQTHTNFRYLRHHNGNDLLIGYSGKPMYLYSSYLGGADFGDDMDTIIYVENTDNTSDGTHKVVKVEIENDEIVKTDNVLSSKMTISRPFIYDGNRFLAMIGHYYDTSTLADAGNTFTGWTFDAIFN